MEVEEDDDESEGVSNRGMKKKEQRKGKVIKNGRLSGLVRRASVIDKEFSKMIINVVMKEVNE
jgi:hypothetical protein